MDRGRNATMMRIDSATFWLMILRHLVSVSECQGY